jgi:sulfoxide reductase heme-binding subunit YedZ
MLRYFKPVIFLACLAPLASLAWRAFHAELGANPIEAITHSTGTCTLVFLLITLSVTPLRKLTRQYWLINLRRMFGLFAFFYGCLHLTTYVWLDKFFDVHEMLADIAKRRFITAGLAGFVLMIPLAVTSTKR